MSKEIETIKAEIAIIESDIKTYQEKVSNKLKSLNAILDEIGNKKSITKEDWFWNPLKNEKCYAISADTGEVVGTGLWSPEYCKYKRDYNIFKTKELAESRKHLSPLQRKLAFILDYLGRDENKVTTTNDYKYYPVRRIPNCEITVSRDGNIVTRHFSQYATSMKMCERAIEIMGDDIYPYLGVEKTICP